MAQDTDKESKTEEPTEKKIADAIEKGNVPRSREMSMFASLLGILVVLAFFTAPMVSGLASKLSMFLDDPGGFRLEGSQDATPLLSAVGLSVGQFLLPIIAALAVAGIAASFFQNAPNIVLEHIRPQWSRLSLSQGWKRVFGSQGQFEVLKAVFKFAAIGVVAMVMLNADRYAVIDAMFTDPNLIPSLMLTSAMRLVSGICVAIIVLVAGDIVWQRLKWRSDLRMTKQELKDEFKQSEGDPLVKARLRSLARDRARRRMIAAVPRATVVIANPTHYAIALRYDRAQGGAPVVVAKGVDLIALKIREIAEKHAIPVIEDKLLARSMYDVVEVDQWIPPEFYKAVAKILYFLYSRGSHARA